MDDSISRQAAIDAFERFIHELGIKDEPYNYGEMALSVRNVPSVNPQPCEDAISRREAIKIFTYNYKGERIPDYDCDNFPVQIAIKKVKKMLRELPPVKPQEPCNDMVSRGVFEQVMWDRDVAIEQLKDLGYELGEKPKTGHWFVDERPESNREVICSNCEQPVFKYHKLDFDYRPKFCPNCGAYMRGDKNG